jgi:hypothetical protein
MRLLLTSLFAILVFGALTAAFAKQVEVQIGHETRIQNAGIKLKFIDLVEDSRCPTDTQCIWAGNAKIKISLSNAGRLPKIFELNTGVKPQTILFAGYEIKIVKLTPAPASNIRIRKDGYMATFSVTKKR